MIRKIVLAHPNRDYMARLAEFLREKEPGWEVSAFTHEAALRLRLQEGGGIDLLAAAPGLLRSAGQLPGCVARAAALVESPGGTEEGWHELALYQPLPGMASAIKALLAGGSSRSGDGCRVWTVFSASGGAGKTSAALHLLKLAGERGGRTLYLNLEALNATSVLFGSGEPDSFSRLLYSLQTEPGRFPERLAGAVRHQPHLRADFIDAPDHPGERAAMTPELLESFVRSIRSTGKYDLVVVDPDSGAGGWHRMLLEQSDRILWLVTDDWQCLDKTYKLLRYWGGAEAPWTAKTSFVCNKAHGTLQNRWKLPSSPAAILPYVPQWKGMEEPGRLFGAAAFSGALEGMMGEWGWAREGGREHGTLVRA